MQKKILFPAFVSLYELIRAVCVVCINPEQLSELPLSWYAAVPFLIFPLLFSFFFYRENETARIMGKMYAIAKIMSFVSLSVYLFRSVPTMLIFRLVSPEKLKIFVLLLIFLLIDGILAIIQAVPKTNRKSELP